MSNPADVTPRYSCLALAAGFHALVGASATPAAADAHSLFGNHDPKVDIDGLQTFHDDWLAYVRKRQQTQQPQG